MTGGFWKMKIGPSFQPWELRHRKRPHAFDLENSRRRGRSGRLGAEHVVIAEAGVDGLIVARVVGAVPAFSFSP
jgi:hypothetical protein